MYTKKVIIKFPLPVLITGMLLINACKKPFQLSPEIMEKAGSMQNMRVALNTTNLQVLTLAGDGGATILHSPAGVTADSLGNIYVTDAANNRIRKITPDGIITTFAGSGAVGFSPGNGTTATFNHPTAIAIDKTGNLFVTDSLNHAIRKITPTGNVTNLAGTGQAGYTEGPASTAQFNGPAGIVVDTTGNIYVADAGNERIRKITSNGLVMLLAGDGNAGYSDLPGRFAEFDTPQGLALDKSGNLYVADKGNKVIRKITQAGVVSTYAGQSGELTNPTAIVMDTTGTAYVADRNSQKIKKITTTGVISTLAGNGNTGAANGPAGSATFNFPAGVAIDASGNIVVADYANNRVRIIRPVATVSTAAGDMVHGPGWYDAPVNQALFNGPIGVATDAAGNVYVADEQNHAIRKITAAGNVITLAGNSTYGYSEGTGFGVTFYSPSALAVDGAGNVYVSDMYNNRIRKITPAGTSSTLAGNGIGGLVDGAGSGAEFNSPGGIILDAAGNIYVADVGNHRIRKITPAGVVSTFAGSSIGYENGTALQAKFNLPFGIAMDGNGNIYVSEEGNNRIRKITPAGMVTTLAGSGVTGFANGAGALAKFNGPQGIAADAIGNVYVADMQNNMIRQVSPAGIVTTLAGSGIDGAGDGLATQASFHWPFGVALSASGSLYVADYFNNLVRKIQ